MKINRAVFLMQIFISFALVYSQSNDEMKFSNNQIYFNISAYDYNENILCLQLKIINNSKNIYHKIDSIVQIKSKNKKNIPVYYESCSVMGDLRPMDTLMGIIVYKWNEDDKWDRLVRSNFEPKQININLYPSFNYKFDQIYNIEKDLALCKIYFDSQALDKFNSTYEKIKDQLDNSYIDSCYLKYELLGNYYFKECKDNDKNLCDLAANAFQSSFDKGNADKMFLKKYFDQLYKFGKKYFENADDNNILYYDSAAYYFGKALNPFLSNNFNTNEIKEIKYSFAYSIYKISKNNNSSSIADSVLIYLDALKETEYECAALFLKGNIKYSQNNKGDAQKCYELVIRNACNEDLKSKAELNLKQISR